jgi:tRNA-dihydrouridine synthase B
MAEGSRMAEKAGADIIDLNFGCPAKEVTGAACGSALMRDPDLACRLIEAAVNATARPGDGQDAPGLGRRQPQRRRIAAAPRRSGSRPSPSTAAPASQFYKGKPTGPPWRQSRPRSPSR